MNKPTRRVRRFIRRKGKGRGKGKGRPGKGTSKSWDVNVAVTKGKRRGLHPIRAYSQNNATSWSAYNAFGIKTLSKGDYLNCVFPGTANNWNAHGRHHLRFVIALFS